MTPKPPRACWCEECDPGITIGRLWSRSRMSVCPECGSKRCPRAVSHRNLCEVPESVVIGDFEWVVIARNDYGDWVGQEKETGSFHVFGENHPPPVVTSNITYNVKARFTAPGAGGVGIPQ